MTQGNEGTMTHDILNFSLRLLLVCSLAAAGLGITYGAAKNNIDKMELQEREDGARLVLEPRNLTAVEDADLLSKVQGTSSDLRDNMIAVFRGEDASGKTGGYAFVLKTKGYNFMNIAVGVDSDGKVIAVDVTTQEETPGIGSMPAESKDYLSKYQGLGPDQLKMKVGVDAWTGATYTSNGILRGVNLALGAFKIVNEGK